MPWDEGVVVLQEGYNALGKLIEVRPAIVVHDSPSLLALYFAAGSTYLSGDFMGGRRRYERSLEERIAVYLDLGPLEFEELSNHRHVLSLLPAGARHAIWLFWTEHWRHTDWFVNLQAPYARAAGSIQIVDHYLDIQIAPDLSWRWKDVDEFEGMCQAGAFSAAEREVIWNEARTVASAIDARTAPFDGEWPSWRPPLDWRPPRINDFWRA